MTHGRSLSTSGSVSTDYMHPVNSVRNTAGILFPERVCTAAHCDHIARDVGSDRAPVKTRGLCSLQHGEEYQSGGVEHGYRAAQSVDHAIPVERSSPATMETTL